jgi:hypothetical protein
MRHEKRSCCRFALPVGEHCSLEIDGSRHDSRVVDLSAEGFGIQVGAGVPVSLGQQLRLWTSDAVHAVQVAHVRPADGGTYVGLLRLESRQLKSALASARTTSRRRLAFEIPTTALFAIAFCGLVVAAPIVLKSDVRWWETFEMSPDKGKAATTVTERTEPPRTVSPTMLRTLAIAGRLHSGLLTVRGLY